MGRAKILIDKSDLEREITIAETAHQFDNHSKLFDFICKTHWASTVKDSLGRNAKVTPQVIYQRVKDFKIELKTKQGQRGGALGQAIVRGTKKFKGDANALSKHVPEKYKPLVNKIKRGSLKSAIKLKCLDCACYQPQEIKNCTVTICPLHGFRPFQDKNKEDETEALLQGS